MGTEGNGTTETGSYTLNGATTEAALNAVTRNANADYVIPTENEWYKAAYYNPVSSSYYLYPTQSNIQPSNVLSATGTNNANYYINGYTDPTNYLTPVGAFASSPSAYGTYDQGGDVWQWNESIDNTYYRGLRGGAFDDGFAYVVAKGASHFENPTAEDDNYFIGLRVAQIQVPEPASSGILAIGLMMRLRRKKVA